METEIDRQRESGIERARDSERERETNVLYVSP